MTSTFRCPSCGSKGFEKSPILNQCSFCDGQEGGHKPIVECCRCHDDIDVSEFDEWSVNPDTAYCGKSERCIP
jgi:hypothetical protein